ncbi:MAG: cobalamin biosynthesis protein CbiX [Candidatus Methanomethylophilus sp.]|nr:cobalamin biosynthesis protein CbiX [Methanomethylophilus sp.]
MTDGILIIGYGTRKGNLEEVLKKQAERLRCRGWEHVGIAFFRVSEPSIPDALNKLVKEGADNIICVPYYIAEGTLTKELIPEKLGLGNKDSGEVEVGGRTVTVSVASAFDGTRVLTDIICDKIADVGGDRDSGILILGHGTRYKALTNMKVIRLNAERLRAMGFSHTTHAFNEFCEPSIKDSLDLLEKQGVKRIIAIPLFIAMGLHLGEEIPEQIGIPSYSDGGEITVNGRRIPVSYTRPVEADNRLVDVIENKVRGYTA